MSENLSLNERLDRWAAEHELKIREQDNWKILDIPSTDGIKRFFTLVLLNDRSFTGVAYATAGEHRYRKGNTEVLCTERVYNQEPAENFEAKLSRDLAYIQNVCRKDLRWEPRSSRG